MDPTTIITHLMRRNPHANEWLPTQTIAAHWIRHERFVLQRHPEGPTIGYILYGPVDDELTLYINHAYIDLRPTNKGLGRKAVATLIARAHQQRARTILFRCPSNLELVAFWRSCGFIPTAIDQTGAPSGTAMVQYELTLPPSPEKLDSGRLRDGLRPNA